MEYLGGELPPSVHEAFHRYLAAGGDPWGAEDAVLAERELAPARRAEQRTLLATLARKRNPRALLLALRSRADQDADGEAPTLTVGTEADALAILETAIALPAEAREDARALMRAIARKRFPGAVLAALKARVNQEPDTNALKK